MADPTPYDDLPDGVVVAGSAGEVVCVNRAAERLLGRPAADLLGLSLTDVLPLRDAEGRDWWACTDPYGGLDIRTGQPERILALPGAPPGRDRLQVTARYVRDHGKVVRVVVALRSARQQSRAERATAELTSAAAHELRSPMAGVRGFARTLVSKWERFSDEDRRRMVEIIDSATDRVTRLLDDMLDVSRLDLGTLSIRPEYMDLGDLVRRVVDGKVAAGEPPDRFATDVPDDLPQLWADRVRMSQVLENLVDNALRHGAGSVRVTARTTEEPPVALAGVRGAPPYVVLEVSDQGAGVPGELREAVFRKFWRADRGSGTGLGLYLVRGLVEAHGGGVAILDAAADGPAGGGVSGTGARVCVCVPSGEPPEPPTSP